MDTKTLSILDIEELSESRNHVYSPPTKGRSTKEFLSIKSKNLNMAGLKEVQPRRSAGYLIILKSPKTHQAEFDLALTQSSSVHSASLRPTAVGQYTSYKAKQTCLPHPSMGQKQKSIQPQNQFFHTPFYPTTKEFPLSCELHPKLPNQQKGYPKDFSQQKN